MKGLFSMLDDKCKASPSYPMDSSLPSLPPPTWLDVDPASFMTEAYPNLPKPLYESREDLFCEPISVFEAKEWIHGNHSSNTNEVNVVKGDWKLYEDRVGKPGWISEKNGSVLDMIVKFGEQPKLILGFLQSYETLGQATVSFPGTEVKKAMILEGIHQSHDSQTYTIGMRLDGWGRDGLLPMGEGGGWFIEPNSTMKVRFENIENKKFKIEYVMSC